ncbi:MAG: HIG1 domain-containing protein [Gammaproteobacteria bacterium]|jgi:hypothetical protein
MSVMTAVVIALAGLTAVTLITGVGSMIHGGPFDERHSEQFMFARIGTQGLTLLLMAIAFILANG